MHEDAGRGGALLAGVRERALCDRRHRVVEIGVRVDDDAVLAAHLRHDPGELARAVREGRRRSHELQADRAGAREGDGRDVAVPRERRARLAGAWQQGDRAGRHSTLAERLDERERAAGRLLRGLEDRRVAGREGGGGHSEGDGEREVPGRDDRGDAARARSAARCARLAPARGPRPGRARSPLARSTRESRSPRRCPRRPPPTACRTRGRRARRARRVGCAGGRRRAGGRARAPPRACATTSPAHRARWRPPARPRQPSRSPRSRRPRRAPPGRWRRAPRPRGGRPRSRRGPAAAGGRRARRGRRSAARAPTPGAARAPARCGRAGDRARLRDYGRAKRSSSAVPAWSAARKDSFAVFSRSRRTR